MSVCVFECVCVCVCVGGCVWGVFGVYVCGCGCVCVCPMSPTVFLKLTSVNPTQDSSDPIDP